MRITSRLILATGLPVLTFVYVFAGFLGCSPVASKESEFKADLSPAEEKALDEMRAETEIGRDMAGRLLAHYGTVGDESLLGYVNQVGRYVAGYGDYPDRRYMFAILDRDTVNAFACPGGYILITAGALRAVQTESQLAHILGHEITHVGKKHMYDTLKTMNAEDAAENTKKGERELDAVLKARQRPKPSETSTGSMLVRYLSGTSGAGLNLLQAAKAGMGVILEKGLDQKLEYEADAEGTKYAIRAGYSPYGLKAFLKRLEASQSQDDIKSLGKTHPPVGQRLARIDAVLSELQAGEIKGSIGLERWRKMQARLPKAQK